MDDERFEDSRSKIDPQSGADGDTVFIDTVAAIEDTPVVEEAPAAKPAAKKEPAKSAYEQAKEKEEFDVVLLRAFEIKLIKARNILKTGDYTAKGEIVAEYTDVNAVGRIMGDLDEGRRFLMEDIHYVYYQDKGWQLEKMKP